MQEKSHALTLLELIFSLIILSFIVLSVVSIETFVRGQTYEADLRAQLQNENLIVLEHISKQAFRAIGNEFLYGPNTLIKAGPESISPDQVVLRIYVDGNGNGQRDPLPQDYVIAYRYLSKTGAAANRFRLGYCGNCSTPACNFPAAGQCAVPVEIISGSGVLEKRKIANLDLVVNKNTNNQLVENYLFVNITSCRDPQNIDLTANPSGTTDNPCVTMQSRILLPSVTTN